MFTPFTPQTSEFIWELMFNNSREWFAPRKEDYERLWGGPFKALARETLGLMQERHPERSWSVHVSRIYRDARRLFGRGPFKDHLWFTITDGDERACPPVLWFEMGAAEYAYGMGQYDATPEMMEKFRRSIDANPARFEALARQAAALEGFHIDGESYKRPKGDPGGVLTPWYNLKRPGLERKLPFGGDLYDPRLPEILADSYEKLLPLYDYLREIYNTCQQGEKK